MYKNIVDVINSYEEDIKKGEYRRLEEELRGKRYYINNAEELELILHKIYSLNKNDMTNAFLAIIDSYLSKYENNKVKEFRRITDLMKEIIKKEIPEEIVRSIIIVD